MAKDLLQVIDEEHATIKQMFRDLENDPNDMNELISFLVTHEVAEEAVPFPKARKLPGGEQVVDDRIDEQAKAEEELDRIEEIKDKNERLAALKQLEDDVLEHAAEEEQTVYKLLGEQCSKEELEEMGEKFLKIKSMAPTHPHPSAPDKPPGNKILGPAAGLADRLRDAVKRM
jgi:hypothetical protein